MDMKRFGKIRITIVIGLAAAVAALLCVGVLRTLAAPSADTYYGGSGDGADYADSSAAQLDSLTGVTTVTSLIRAGQTISTISRSSNSVSIALTSDYPNDNLVVGQSIVIAGVEGFNGTFTIATVTDQSNFDYAETADDATGTTDSGSIAGGHYSTLTSWEADRAADLTATNTLEVAECYDDWASGLDDNLTIDGWTTDATRYIEINTPSSEVHDSRWDTTAFRLAPSTGVAITNNEDEVRVDGLQISSADDSVYVSGASGNGDERISDTIIKGNATASKMGITTATASTIKIWNNVIYDVTGTTAAGIYINQASAVAYIYNNTLVDCTQGINLNAGTATAINNIVKGSGNTTAYVGTFAAATDTNATDGTDAIGQGTNRTSQTFTFVDEALNDFRLATDDAGATGEGTDLSADANCAFGDDIDEHIRVGWDIGADEAAVEFVSAIRASGQTGPAPDYNKLSDWESGCDGVDYTVNATRVFSHGGITGTISDGDSLTGATSSATGTCVHASATQILIKSISGTFQSGEQVYQTLDTNYVTTSYAGDTVVLVAECYNDWPSGLDDRVSFFGDSNGFISDAQHNTIVRTPTSERHDGTEHSGFYLKPTNDSFIFFVTNASHYKIIGIEIDGSARTASTTAVLVGGTAGEDIEVADCLVYDVGTADVNGHAMWFALGSNIKCYNNIIYNISALGIYESTSTGLVYAYNNTLYNCNTRDNAAYGAILASDNLLLKNNVAIGSLNDFKGTFHADSDYNLSSDDTAPGANSLKSSNLDPDASGSTEFANISAGSEDLHLKAGANAIDAGTDLSSDDYIRFSTDIDGEFRDTFWEMGADEVPATATFDITATLDDTLPAPIDTFDITATLDNTPPDAPTNATIAAGEGWDTNWITSFNRTAVKVSGNKSSDTVQIKIEIDDEDTFDSAKTNTLSGLGTELTYADATGIDVTTATALADGNIAIRVTAYDEAGNSSTQTILTGTGTFKKDIVDPSGLANLSVSAATSTTATLTWTAATDDNWTTEGAGHYEIWYGTDLTKVQNRDSSSPNGASEWDNDNDVDLATSSTDSTTIDSGLDLDNNTYYFKIWAIDDAGNEQTTTYACYVRVTSPDGGETWLVGTEQEITWDSGRSGTGNVAIDYSPDAGTTWKTVAASTADDGTHTWTVPDDAASDNVKIRILYPVIDISGTAEAKVSEAVNYESGDKILALDVSSDFTTGEYVTIASAMFGSFTAASAWDNLELSISGPSGLDAFDDKYVAISTIAGAPFKGTAGDGWDFSESAEKTLE